jgi:hypothetical protein
MAAANLPADFVQTANDRFRASKDFWRNWRAEARDDYAFVAGNQWMAEDLTILLEQKRPPITFNYSEKMIDAVVGAEVSNRQEIRYAPRDPTDAPLSELWTNAAKWARDEGDHEDEESDAFRDTLICGMGWTYTAMEYEVDLDGMIGCGRVDPLEMFPDPSAMKPSLVDRRFNNRCWWIDERIAKRRWPSNIAFAMEAEDVSGVNHIRTGQRYEGDEVDDKDAHKGQVQIRHYECVEFEPFYRVATEQSIIEVPASEFADMKSSLDEAGITYVKQFKRVYYYAYFAGDTLLEGDHSPNQAGFCYQAMTGKRDRNRRYWYGLTKVMKDPQRWANKWLSQILHIINSNAKGGLLAETGAFVDPKAAQDNYASPDSIVFLNEGGINKIKEKSMVNYPSGLDRLMEFALSSLPQVTGINLEALGLAGREQANVLEQSRKQAAYGLLAPLFDSLRRYRKNQGRVLLYFIHNYISDGRLIRIGGPESQQFIPLTKAKNAPRYDIIVDQSPTSPDVKTKTWEVLQVVLPNMMKAGIPIPPDLIDFTPLPSALILKWKQFIAKTGGVTGEQAQQMQQQMQQLQQENQQLTQKLQDKTAEFQLKAASTKAEVELSMFETREQLKLQLMKLQGELTIKREQARADHELAQQKTDADVTLKREANERSGENEQQANIMDAVNKLIETIGKLDAAEAAASTE